MAASVLAGVLVIEICWAFVPKRDHTYQWNNSYRLFKDQAGQSVFRNIDSFYLYRSHSNVRSVTYYHTELGWVKEYDYVFSTNNLGLVQENDIDEQRDSVLLLGNSFTEGQGAAPWIGSIRSSSDVQLINGGLQGTGFRQWTLLHDYLIGRKVRVTKLLVIFISDDFDRLVQNMPEKTLACISNWRLCDGTESYYGLPPFENDLPEFLERLKAMREGRPKSLKESLAQVLPATTVAYRYVKAAADAARSGRAVSPAHKDNQEAIATLVRNYGRRVTFVHLPQKDEVKFGISASGRAARLAISEAGGLIYDGFARCGMSMDDYYKHDGHPNANGYAKISRCVSRVLDEQ